MVHKVLVFIFSVILVVTIIRWSKSGKSDVCYFDEIPEYIAFENNAHAYFGGVEKVVVRDSAEILAYCEMLSNLAPTNVVTGNNSRFEVYIKVSESEWTWDYLTLMYTRDDEMIFSNKSECFKNDELALKIYELVGVNGH